VRAAPALGAGRSAVRARPALVAGRSARGTLAVAAALAAAGLPACGGSGEGAASGDGLSSAEARDARVDFAECMREHGVDMPDPRPGAAPGFGFGGGGAALRDDPEAREAFETCGRQLEGLRAQIPDEQREELREAALDFARCMRDEGIDFPDPTRAGAIARMDLDRDDPATRSAMEKCQGELPDLPGR
jgi:hypothetical protein